MQVSQIVSQSANPYFQLGGQPSTDQPRLVKFFLEMRENKKKSREAGWVIHETVVMRRAYSANGDGKIDGDYRDIPASQEDLVNYKPLIEAAIREAGADRGPGGLLVSYLPFLSIERQADLRHAGIFTAEQLAELDVSRVKLGPTLETEVEQTKAYLEVVKDTAIVSKQAREIVQLKSQLEAALEQVGELKTLVSALGADEPEDQNSSKKKRKVQ